MTLKRKEGDLILDVRINKVKKLGESNLTERQYKVNDEKLAFRRKLPEGDMKALIILLKSIEKYWREEMTEKK